MGLYKLFPDFTHLFSLFVHSLTFVLSCYPVKYFIIESWCRTHHLMQTERIMVPSFLFNFCSPRLYSISVLLLSGFSIVFSSHLLLNSLLPPSEVLLSWLKMNSAQPYSKTLFTSGRLFPEPYCIWHSSSLYSYGTVSLFTFLFL